MEGSRRAGCGPEITIRTGTGSARTRLAAFDAALLAAGVGNLNLVTLSSVIPPRSRIVQLPEPAAAPLVAAHGDRLYCVLATAYADQPGDSAWAGLGWTYGEETGGLFVEHAGATEDAVLEEIGLSLTDMGEQRGGHYGPVRSVTAAARCADTPACAVVVATYEVAGWSARG